MSDSINLKMNVTAIVCRLCLICVCLFAIETCYGRLHEEHMLFDFESDAELDNLQWKCHTLYSLCETHVTHGKKSLKLELYPSDYPGFRPVITERDWRRYRGMGFDIYNPEKEAVEILIRIDDRNDYPGGADWYRSAIRLQPGMNHIMLPLNMLSTIKTHRILDLRDICRFLIFMSHPSRTYVIYIDYIRLVP